MRTDDDGAVKRHWLLRYGFALLMFGLLVVIAQGLTYLGPNINQTIPIVFLLVATAWWGGLGPGILFSVMLEGATIIFAPLPPNSTPASAWFGYLSVFGLYVFLVLVIGGLRSAQRKLTAHRDLLQVTLASIGEGVVTTDVKGRITFINPAAQMLTGWPASDARGRHFDEVIAIVHETTREPVENPVSKVLLKGSIVGLANHSTLVTRDGRYIPIDDTAAPISDNGDLKGVVLVFADVSERKLAERSRRETEIMHRLVDAQEAERRRIARDLHDHLGQRMTALRLQIADLAERCSADPDLVEVADQAQRAASAVDRDVGFLSWELRPTELENFGLASALGTFVREWSGHHGIDAEFHATCNGETRLPHPVETNLYRIVQEALNNVAKHSGAESVCVLLQSGQNDIVVTIEDDGRGFSLSDGQTNGDASQGLGLIGMKERAALLKGFFEIDSSPGAGTTVLVRVPSAGQSKFERSENEIGGGDRNRTDE